VYNLLRRLVFAAALVATAPLIFITWLEGVVTSRRSEKLYGSCKELLASVPTFFGEYFRGAFYWAVCAHVETGVVFLYGSMVAHRDTTVRRGAIIGCHSIVGYADIGPDVMLAARVSILSGKYQHGRPGELRGAGVEGSYSRVTIGERSWIGEGALVLANVGKNCTVGAGSVIYKDVPDDATVLGNPARKVNLE